MLAAHLHYLLEGQPLADLGRPVEHLPREWIEHAVQETCKASIRRRWLPAEQEPLAWLFEKSTQDAAAYAFKGLSLWSMDGTTLRTADSAANRAHYGAQSYASGKVASYPQVWAVRLTAISTHLVDDIAFACHDNNEMLYATGLVPRIPDDSFTVFDKGSFAAEILCGLIMQGSNPPLPASTQEQYLLGSHGRRPGGRGRAHAHLTAGAQEVSGTARTLGGVRHSDHRRARTAVCLGDIPDRSPSLQGCRSGRLLYPVLASENQSPRT